jgi:hypothetical protein
MEFQTNIWIIWLNFALLFGSLAGYHFWLSKKSSPQFKLPEISNWFPAPGAGIPINIGFTAKDVGEAFDSFRDAFNSSIKEYNKSSSRQNIAQAIGYLLALGVAIVSLIITI